MKICHITSVHADNDVRIVLKEVSSLSKYYETTLLANQSTTMKHKGYMMRNLDLKYSSRIKRILFSKKKVLSKALEVDADIYHFHDPELLGVGNELIKQNKKVIYDIHEDTSEQILSKYYIPKFLRKTVSRIYSSYEIRSVKNYTAIITATPFLKGKFEKYNTNIVDVNNYPLLHEFVDIIPINVQTPRITYIGGLTEERGIFQMIELANHFSNIKFCFCGVFSNPKDKDKAEEMIKYDNIEFKGFVSRLEIKKTLESSTIGLVLLEKNERYKDSLPIKMFEYMAAGLPVIATDFNLWDSILKEARAGITVNPNNLEEMVKAISNLISDTDYAVTLGKNGRKYVFEKYNWNNEEKKLLDIYQKIEEELL